MMKNQDKFAEIKLHAELIDKNLLSHFVAIKTRRQQCLKLLGLTDFRNKLVLDAGCGEGMDSAILGSFGNRLVGIELSPKVACQAKALAKQSGASVEVIIADLESMPLCSDAFDAVYSGWVLHHFKDLGLVSTEISRVLKPSGYVGIVEPNGSSVAVKLSQIFEGIARPLLVTMNIDTPNETLHTVSSYCRAFSKNGVQVNIKSCFFSEQPPVPKHFRFAFRFIVLSRNLIYRFLMLVMVSPLKGTNLLIYGKKVG